ncbi:Glycine betaine transporter [invertebrate metagenome]|uniref:Glycine betaine transporter n=1 Tax=invertebrate metagenome TaxID=1711999 RepID=A0A2H9T4Z3_9ZZZZ
MTEFQSVTSTDNRLKSPVFWISVVLISMAVGYTSLFPHKTQLYFGEIQSIITTNFSWFYILTVACFLICITFLCVSKYGDIKLGLDHTEPEYSFSSWFAMLFSAGMGVGLLYFGVSEPVMHYLSPPIEAAENIAAAKEAMAITFFHWGFHAWGIYAIVALILAFFSYRHGLPLSLRSALYPIVGDKIYGPIGHAVDIFAVLGTVAGIATALGLGASQVSSGLNYLFGMPVTPTTQTLLIVGITALSTLSVASGLNKGIRWLSEINLILAAVFLVLILCLGPTVQLLQMLVQNTGMYLSEIVYKTFNLYAYEPTDWIGGWTVFYWAFWLSCSPFVGIFIARISKGRTIREFIIGTLFVPVGLSFVWMTVFGNSAINLIANHGASQLGQLIQQDVSLALFRFLEYFPFAHFLSAISLIILVIFFVTTADSGAMVLDMLASGGSKKKSSVWYRVFWSCAVGVVAISLMFAGGLQALQTALITTALPFAIIVMIAMYGLIKALRIDVAKKESLVQTTLPPKVGMKPIPWQRRLSNLIEFPSQSDVHVFLKQRVISAMNSVKDELHKQGVESEVSFDAKKSIPNLLVLHGEEQDFIYRVSPRPYLQPSFTVSDDDSQKYFRAEVFLREGGQNYDIMGWTENQIIGDIIDQYERHMHFLHMLR